MHILDGYEDSDHPWRPCEPPCSNLRNGWVSGAVARKLSASIISRAMKRTFREIPLFSFDPGYIIHPDAAKAATRCGYMVDASTDDNKPLCENQGPPCIAGCGDPPQWCDPQTYGKGWYKCGHDWDGRFGVQPWHPKDVNQLLNHHADFGATYSGIGNFEGYNEFILESHDIKHFPHDIQAFYIVQCEETEQNLQYRGGTSATCADARDRGVDAYRKFTHSYGIDPIQFPLLLLIPTNWDAPFQIADVQ